MNKKGFAGIGLIIAVILGIVAIGGGVYFVTRKSGIDTPSAQPIISQIPSDWKTYTNSNYGYQVSYPSDSDMSSNFDLSTEPVYLRISLSESSLQTAGTNYENAYIDISARTSAQSINDCHINYHNAGNMKTETTSINGILFYKSAGGSGATGHYGEDEDYSVVKNGTCYNLNLGVVTANSSFINHPVQSFDEEKAFKILRQILNTFKFIDLQTIQVNFFPIELGQCQMTTVAAIEFDSWREDYNISFSNKGLIIIDSAIKPSGFAVGDPVNFCYVGHADPSACEDSGANPGDLRPYVYRAKNLNTGAEIEGSPNLHVCSGA